MKTLPMHPSAGHVAHLPLHPLRQGSVLLAVLVIIVLLTLAAYSYVSAMLTELKAAEQAKAEVQSRLSAQAGIEYVATLVSQRGEPGTENLYHDPARFRGVLVANGERPHERNRFSIVAPAEQDTTGSQVRYGLVDESGRLNLNLLDALGSDEEEILNRFLGVTDITEDVISAIRDWVDADDEPLPQGCESEYYEGLNPSYRPANGPFRSLDELLLVRGVTPELLYGEDSNRNGLLDPWENDGQENLPFDNADGALNTGWSAFFTVQAREANLRSDGGTRIDVNNGILTDLYDELAEEYDEDVARFVVAFRISGPIDQPPEEEEELGGVNSSGSAESRRQQEEQLREGLTRAIAEAVFSEGGKVTRGGLDLSKGGNFKVNSLFELIGSRTNAVIDGATTELPSPWPAETGTLPSILPQLFDVLSTSADEYLEGRVNINQSRREVLLGVPGMTEELADQIASAQILGDEGLSADQIQRRSTTGWLFTEGLVDIWTMRELDRYLTARGDVFRVQVLGLGDVPGPIARVEATIDATQRPPRILQVRDLSGLGTGYPRAWLLPVP